MLVNCGVAVTAGHGLRELMHHCLELLAMCDAWL